MEMNRKEHETSWWKRLINLRGTSAIYIQELQDPKQAAVDDSVKRENLG